MLRRMSIRPPTTAALVATGIAAMARTELGTAGTGSDTHERHTLDRCIEHTFATARTRSLARSVHCHSDGEQQSVATFNRSDDLL